MSANGYLNKHQGVTKCHEISQDRDSHFEWYPLIKNTFQEIIYRKRNAENNMSKQGQCSAWLLPRSFAGLVITKFGSRIWRVKAREPLQWASYQIRKIAGCACAGNAGNGFARRRFQRKLLVSDPGMHHGTCVTHVPWCMPGSPTCGDGGNVPGIPGACAPAILRIWQEAHCRLIRSCLGLLYFIITSGTLW